MEFLKTIKQKRSFLHNFLYVILNVILAVALLLIIRLTDSVWLALAVLLLSKWRTFAVRARFWFANLQADLVSLIVNLSYVAFIYNINNAAMSDQSILISQLVWTIVLIIWLVFVKSGAKRYQIVLQAAISLLMGISAIFVISHSWPSFAVIIALWIISYSSARHVINSYDEESRVTLLSTLWGFFMAELGWLTYHWTIAYEVPAIGVKLPQISILAMCFSFLAYKCYDSFYHYRKIRFNDIVLPLALTIIVVSVLVIFFNNVNPSAI